MPTAPSRSVQVDRTLEFKAVTIRLLTMLPR